MYVPWFKPEPIAIALPDISLPLVGSLPEEMLVHPFGALVAVAVLLGTHIVSTRGRQEGFHPRVLGEMSAYVLIGGFVLGHMLDAVFYHWDVVRQNPIFVLQLWNGLSSFGGFLGAMMGGIIWLVRRGYPLIPFADVGCYAFPFGWIFGRLGCFVVHDHPGSITDFPLAVADYQVGTPPFSARHDLGFYEVLWCLAVIPLFVYLGRKKRRRGLYVVLVPLLYAPVRFGLDFLRATDITNGDPRILAGLTPGHFGAMLLFAAGIAAALYLRNKPRFELPRDARWTAEDEGKPDPRGVEALLEVLDTVRGPVRVTEPNAAATMVERWPGGLLLVRARDVEDWALLAEEVEALGPAEVHVWLTESTDEAHEALREIIEANPGAERDVAVIRGGDAEAVAEALGVPVWLEEDDGEPWAVLERDDGGVVFGMLGEYAAA